MPLSEARKRANKKWDEKNKEARRRMNDKSAAKRFVRDMATPEEWAEFVRIYNEGHTQQETTITIKSDA
ncbi:hypothetical protein [Leuconostoc lactis]|uniref:hypothetical protein n=1 Tax=Leuconostoc lactis TaxID=1246 RepID=UPI000E967BA3|nr:hypothetical protein [Leuconostoc lactis]HBP97354.1 hypothetical protein [Leuconostoc lactis]